MIIGIRLEIRRKKYADGRFADIPEAHDDGVRGKHGEVHATLHGSLMYEETQTLEPIYWLEDRPSAFAAEETYRAKCTSDCAYEVSIVGRESACRAGFGHLGQYPKMIIAISEGQMKQIDLH